MVGSVCRQARVPSVSSYAWNPDILHSPKTRYPNQDDKLHIVSQLVQITAKTHKPNQTYFLNCRIVTYTRLCASPSLTCYPTTVKDLKRIPAKVSLSGLHAQQYKTHVKHTTSHGLPSCHGSHSRENQKYSTLGLCGYTFSFSHAENPRSNCIWTQHYALKDLWLVQQWPSLIHTTHCFGNYAHSEVERNNPAQDRSPALIAINIQNTNQAFCLSLRKKPHLIFADFHLKKRLGFCGSDQNLSHACHRVHFVQYTSATNP
jgi:hypothetical protein